MIKAIIIDDERDARFIIKSHLDNLFPETVSVVGQASKIKEGIALIKNEKPDLVFLDIQMPSGTGFDILEDIGEINFEVIFITAYNQYAVKAFECSALGYLLKPLKMNDLEKSVHKAIEKINSKKYDLNKRLKLLIENYGDDKQIKKLVVTHVKGFNVLAIDEIIRLESDRNYTTFVLLGDKKITASKTLGEYDTLLSDFGFFRIHQSTLVNLRHVSAYHKEDGGVVEMVDKVKLKVSRYRKQAFIQRFL